MVNGAAVQGAGAIDVNVVMAMADFPPDNEAGLDQPVTRWHELRNVLQHVVTQSAVIAERQNASAAQGARIEASVSVVHSQLGDMEKRTNKLENEVSLLTERLAPVRALVFGLVTAILLAVIGALVALILK